MNTPDEIFDIVNIAGEVIGQAKRSEVHGNPGLLHRVVHCLVFNGAGELYLQKRALTKDVQPGKWDTSVGGHLMPGETIIDAVKRETKEELGVESESFEYLYQYRMSNSFETELVDTFKIIYNGKIITEAFEISEGRFWSCNEIEENILTNIFTPNFIDEWNRWKQLEKKV